MPEAATLVLARRARILAQPLADTDASSADHHLLLFTSRASGFAIPLAGAAVVRSITDPQEVAGGPVWLRGLAAIAGRIMPVVDIKTYLSAEARAPAPAGQRELVLVVEDGGVEAALTVDTLDGIERAFAGDVKPFPLGTSPRVAQVARGLLGNRVLLDPARLVEELGTAFSVGGTAPRVQRPAMAGPAPADGEGT